MSALDDYRRFSITISGFKTTHDALVVRDSLLKFRQYADRAIDELEAENTLKDKMLRLAILDGEHPAGMDADYLVDLRARAERNTP